ERESEADEGGAQADEGGAQADDRTESDGRDGADSRERTSQGTGDGAADDGAVDAEPPADRERTPIETLEDHVGESVRIEGRVVSIRQTGGPTVFEVRDETGVVDCAAFVEAGVRAYPEVEVDDAVRIDGEAELRYDDLQVETGALERLDGDAARAVDERLSTALTERARPESVDPLAAHDPVEAVGDRLRDAAEAVRRAVFESRPVVVRHMANADGYVAGAALERAVLPLVREEYARSDAEYHYFDRRPLETAVYDMDAATNDVTRMLEDRDRHDEKIPLVVLVGVGSTVESSDGLGLLGVYGAERVVVDAATADEEIEADAEVLVNPGLAGADATQLSTGALGANLAVAVDDDVREDLAHLSAVSYWEDTPEVYAELAAEAGYDAERVRELREALALEAYYQSYEDKRELVTDILFGDDEASTLAAHVSEQFRIKLEDEVDTAEANLDRRAVDGVDVAVLDTDAYSHRFDFPPTSLLLDEIHRRNREGERFVTVGVGMDELSLRSTAPLDVRAVAERTREAVPDAGVTAAGVRDGRIEFLSGAREAVVDAVIEAVAADFE
ncbi:MAG: OB-fold nucleic acid binding domain-containing protein, partial [Salinigranum sp.]